ncbi:MAG TPA: hypothetical protein VLA76_00090 [Candidatus Angelobacter sp.]|nr:hypothetical protein [Candidatus Angelobacter sp.]
MSDQEQYFDIQADDPDWVRDQLERRPGTPRVLVRLTEDDADLEGHIASSTLRLRAFEDEDDTEGHAIAVHFPTREDADAFRRRLVLTGALTGTLVLGAAGGFGLANIVAADAAGGGAVTTEQASERLAPPGGSIVDGDSPARGTVPVPE